MRRTTFASRSRSTNRPLPLSSRSQPGQRPVAGFVPSSARLRAQAARTRADFVALSSLARIMHTSDTTRSIGLRFKLSAE